MTRSPASTPYCDRDGLSVRAHILERKSDTNDATWIADLLALGLIRSSCVPPAPIQELRDLTRTQWVREIRRHTQRLQKTLEDANVKLTEIISDVLETSGRAIPSPRPPIPDPRSLVDHRSLHFNFSRSTSK